MELRLNALTRLNGDGSSLRTSSSHGRENQRASCCIHFEIPCRQTVVRLLFWFNSYCQHCLNSRPRDPGVIFLIFLPIIIV
jgi:hypothetical protein